MTNLINTQDAALQMGISVDAVQKLCRTKMLNGVSKDKLGHWQIPLESIELWISQESQVLFPQVEIEETDLALTIHDVSQNNERRDFPQPGDKVTFRKRLKLFFIRLVPHIERDKEPFKVRVPGLFEITFPPYFPLMLLVALVIFVFAIIAPVIGVLVDLPDAIVLFQDRFGECGGQEVMEGDFNIAVTPLRVDGEGVGLRDTRRLAQNINNAIEHQIEEFTTELGSKNDIWVRSPNDLEPVIGVSIEERAENARKLAGCIDADIVVYGLIEISDLSAEIRPEFYIANSDTGLNTEVAFEGESQTASVVGWYETEPIQVELISNTSSRVEASNEFAELLRILVFVFDGISHYVIGQYDLAAEAYSRALIEANDIERWNSSHVIHVLNGNSYLKLASSIRNNVTDRAEYLQKAEEHYKAALIESPDYARANIGLGSVFYIQAFNFSSLESAGYENVDLESLDLSISSYERALSSDSEKPPLADIPVKAHFGIGQAYLMEALVLQARMAADPQIADEYNQQIQENLERALSEFQYVINTFTEETNERIQELAAHSFARQGLIYFVTGQHEEAFTSYEKAVEFLPCLQYLNGSRDAYNTTIISLTMNIESTNAETWLAKNSTNSCSHQKNWVYETGDESK